VWESDTLAAAGPLAARYGAEIVTVGDGLPALSAEDGQAWDAMALVRYPSRQAFASMVKDPDYREKAGPLRAASLSEAVLQPIRMGLADAGDGDPPDDLRHGFPSLCYLPDMPFQLIVKVRPRSFESARSRTFRKASENWPRRCKWISARSRRCSNVSRPRDW
jgi:hypothetical protein